ncbi:MAG: permease-like cell division protein FtsX [Actinomycetota bacterium]|nr:permease-like cell division protein FtsX [Actinomycetota bacterium]
MRAKVLVGEALRSLTANLSSSVAATITVLIAMFLFGVFIAIGSWLNSWTDHLKREVVVKVFFDKGATTKQVDAVRVRLERMREVKKIEFVSKEDALEDMQRRFPELTKNVVQNPFGPSYTVTPKRAEQVETVADRVEGARPPGVDKVTYKEKTTERVLTVARIVGYVALVGSLTLLVASAILIANTIRLSIFARRREIEVMKLVGATNWFVRGPFMLEGLICGFFGSLAAVALLMLARELVVSRIAAFSDRGEEVHAISFPVIAGLLVATSLVVGAAGSGVTLRRFLRI